jgi:site-specific recombinase XerD
MIKRHTLSYMFYLCKDKAKKTNIVPIYMRITIDGERSELTVHRSINPKKWTGKGGFAIGTSEKYRNINRHLDYLRSKVYEALQYLIDHGKPVTARSIKNYINGTEMKRYSLIQAFEHHNKLLSERIDRDYSYLTLVRYQTTLNHIKDFLWINYKAEDLYLSQLDYEFITRFEHYLKATRDCNHNTTVKYIRNLRKIVNMAVKNEWLGRDPFMRYSAKLKTVDRDYINANELAKIEQLILENDRLRNVRDVFVFSCYAGLAYVDVAKLTNSNIVQGVDGALWISTNRAKTDTRMNIPLLPKALEILYLHRDYSTLSDSNSLLPVVSNQKMNLYLKEIARLAKMNKNLTFHLSRHTFATTVTLANGVPIETVSKMLGHNSIRTTQVYAKVIDKKVAEDMRALRIKLSQGGFHDHDY